MICIKRV